MSADHRAFREFEPGPLRRVLEAFARAHGTAAEALEPRDPVGNPEALASELEGLGLRLDLDRLKNLRQVVGVAVPLLERHPRAHH